MKQGLQLKIGQQLTMTPQLQQAIRLLQLSTLDLQQEIQQALQENPMLEVEEESGSEDSAGDGAETRTNGDGGLLDSTEGGRDTAAGSEREIDAMLPATCPSIRSGRISSPRARRRAGPRRRARTTTSTAATAAASRCTSTCCGSST